jgi:hypothetical protein
VERAGQSSAVRIPPPPALTSARVRRPQHERSYLAPLCTKSERNQADRVLSSPIRMALGKECQELLHAAGGMALSRFNECLHHLLGRLGRTDMRAGRERSARPAAPFAARVWRRWYSCPACR